jgi:NTE family protein
MQRLTDAERHDALSRIGNQARSAERYLDINKTRYVHLVDGGVSDNLALRSAGLAAQNVAQSAPGAANIQLDHIRRFLVLSVDGEGAQDTSVAQRKLMGGIFSLFGLVSGAQIDRYNFETLTTVSDQLRQLVAAVARNRCAEARVIDGTKCDDVRGALIHVSLTELPDSPTKDRLEAIPTGLTIKREDVDALVAAGRAAILTSVPLRDFLEDYSPAPVEQGPGRARPSQNAGRS